MVGGLGQTHHPGRTVSRAKSGLDRFGGKEVWGRAGLGLSLPAPPKDAVASPVTGRENGGRSTASGRRQRGEAPAGGDRDGRRGEAARPEGRSPCSAIRRPPLPPGPGPAAGGVGQGPGLNLPAVSRQPPGTPALLSRSLPPPCPRSRGYHPPQPLSGAEPPGGGRPAATVTSENFIYFISTGEHLLSVPSLPACPPRRSPGGQLSG